MYEALKRVTYYSLYYCRRLGSALLTTHRTIVGGWTESTFVRFVIQVDVVVLPQLIVPRKLFKANFTLEWTL